jgi:hypothetical protein
LLILLLGSCEQAPKATPAGITEDWERDPKTQSLIDRDRIPALQSKATAACLCERKRGHKAEALCWSDFWKEVNGYRHSSAASACGPGSSAYVDFDDGSETTAPSADMSVMMEWGYGACSADEVDTKKAEYERKSKMRGC